MDNDKNKAVTSPAKAMPKTDGSGRTPTVESAVREFESRLQALFPARFARRPAALKQRVLASLARSLPPHPRPSRRPKEKRITKATELYLRQEREKAEKRRSKINWFEIAKQADPSFVGIRSEWVRRRQLDRLRNSVYARVRRTCGTRRERTPPIPAAGQQ